MEISDDDSSPPASETPSLPDLLDEEGYPASDVVIHSPGIGSASYQGSGITSASRNG